MAVVDVPNKIRHKTICTAIMDTELYDEFGNYLGPEFSGSENEASVPELHTAFDEDDRHELGDSALALGGGDMDVVVDVNVSNQIVLHEDKKYYPDADEVYPGVHTVTLEEDAQDIEEPIIKPIKVKNFSVLEKDAPSLHYSAEFVSSLMNTPTLIRNVAILGHFHHGKTMFTDTLVQSTHKTSWDPTKDVRYTDCRKDEQDRELSIKSTPVSLVLESMKEKSYLFNVIDCPGHINFSDESTAALRVTDGAVIIVDAVEGVMLNTERLIKHAMDTGNVLCLVWCENRFLVFHHRLFFYVILCCRSSTNLIG